MIVSAITSHTEEHGARMSLFLVPREMEGVTVVSTPMVDSRNSAMVSFDNVVLPSESLIGGLNKGLITLQPALNITNIHLSAELLGIANEAFQRTLQYLKSRKQFGSNIGSFQALQHRAAKLWTEIELCKSVVMKALRTLDETPADIGAIASVAKAKTCQVAELATNEAIQMLSLIHI